MDAVVTKRGQARPLESKKERVLAALRAGKSAVEAAEEAGCAVQYVYTIIGKSRARPVSVPDEDSIPEPTPARCAGVAELDNETPAPFIVVPLPGIREIAAHIWPTTMDRTGGRYRMGDERFTNAAKDAYEAADCFLIKARGHSPEVVNAALVVWPALWNDYASRGRVITNMQVSAESAAMAMSAAEKYLDHAK